MFESQNEENLGESHSRYIERYSHKYTHACTRKHTRTRVRPRIILNTYNH